MSTHFFRFVVICSVVTLFTPGAQAALAPASDFVMVKAGVSYSLALKSDGTLWAWGSNNSGELGNGTTSPALTPDPVVCGAAAGAINHCSQDGHLKGVSQIAAGNGLSLALLNNGAVLAWGVQSKFEDVTDSITPVYAACGVVSGPDCSLGHLTNASRIAVGFSHALILFNDGLVVAWGTNNGGNLGDNNPGVASSTPVQVFGLGSGSGVTAIAAGQNSSLALKSDGTVLAWGNNTQGQLGDGTLVNRNTPVQVFCREGDLPVSPFCSSGGHLQGVSAIATGVFVSFALLNDSTVFGWGLNSSGQLGDGTVARKTRPVNVCAVGATAPCLVATGNILHGVAMLFGSSLSSSGYALKFDGKVLAWGSNANGQLGDGSTNQRTTPDQVSGLGSGSGVTVIAAGGFHCLVLRSDGTALSWGNNASGQLGNGTILARTTPVQPVGLGAGSGAIAIAARAQFALALKSDGTILAWGNNGNGQLGDGTNTNRIIPVPVACKAGDLPGSAFCSNSGSLRGALAISAGNSGYSLALMTDGTVLAWGTNANGQIGDGTTTQTSTPVHVCAVGAVFPCSAASGNILQGVSAIAAGGAYSVALKSDGRPVAWGNNNGAAIGDGSSINRTTPVHVCAMGATFPCTVANNNILQGVSAIAAGNNSPFALMSDGTVLAWGLNLANQLGDGTASNRNTPVNVCAVGALFPCSVANNNILQGVSAIAAFSAGGFARTNAGLLVAWGFNSGALGDDTSTTRSVPVHVCALGATAPCSVANGNILQGVSTIAGGNSTGYAITSSQMVLAWGANDSGQLGDGTLITRFTPVQVYGMESGSGVVAISGGNGFATALKSDGAVLAWGANDVGELGDGTVYTANLTPSNVLFDDITPPTLTFGTPAPSAPSGTNGWYITNVSIPWAGRDVDSELDPSNPTSPLVLTNEGAAVSGSVTLCDIAGNCAAFDSPSFMIDKTAPQVTVSVGPDVLWPPDHQNVSVTITIEVNDNLALSAHPIAGLTASSSEPDVAGTGDVPGDVRGQDGFASPVALAPGTFVFDIGSGKSGSSSTTIPLRAERAVRGNGRVYTIMGTVRDAAGNPTTFAIPVAVPRDQSGARGK